MRVHSSVSLSLSWIPRFQLERTRNEIASRLGSESSPARSFCRRVSLGLMGIFALIACCLLLSAQHKREFDAFGYDYTCCRANHLRRRTSVAEAIFDCVSASNTNRSLDGEHKAGSTSRVYFFHIATCMKKGSRCDDVNETRFHRAPLPAFTCANTASSASFHPPRS